MQVVGPVLDALVLEVLLTQYPNAVQHMGDAVSLQDFGALGHNLAR